MHPNRFGKLVVVLALLVAPAAQSFTLIGARWPVGKFPIAWKLDADASRDSTNDAVEKAAVQNAFDSWHNVGGTRAQVAAFTDLPAAQRSAGDDNTNKVFWIDDNTWQYSRATLGVTTPLYYTTGEIFDADIVFNGRDYSWRTGNGNYCSNCTDIFSIAVHEQGHFFGLDHSCSPSSSGVSDNCGSGSAGTLKRNAVMFAAYPGYPKQAQNGDDIDGIRALYPAATPGSGVQGSGCVTDTECGSGLACTSSGGVKICAAACSGTGQSTCPSGYTCQTGRCLYSANELGDLCKACSATSDCSNGICIGTDTFAICSRSCGTGANQGCPTGYGCYTQNQGDTTGFCYPESETCANNCSAQNPCPTGQTCQSGSCRWTIGNEGDPCPSGACASNLVCVGTDTDGYLCRRVCTTTANCANGQQCEALSDGSKACFPGGTVGPGGTCTSPSDCIAGTVCVATGSGATSGTCYTSCTPGGASTQCPTNYTCESIGSGEGICYPGSTQTRVGLCEACGGDVLCNTGLLCIAADGDSTCLKRCTSDSQCGSGKRCGTVGSNRYCTCNTGALKGDGVACAADAECQVGFACIVDGTSAGPVCRAGCVSGSDCTSGEDCTSVAGATYCVPSSGVDAGTPEGTDGGDVKPPTFGCPGCTAADPAGLLLAFAAFGRRRRAKA